MKKQILFLILAVTTLNGSSEKCMTSVDLISPVENLDFNGTLTALQTTRRHGGNYDKALKIINGKIQETKSPVGFNDKKGLAQSVIGGTLALGGAIGLAGAVALFPKKDLDLIEFFLIGVPVGLISTGAIALGVYNMRKGIKTINLPYHRNYPKALAIKALLDSYKDEIIYCR